MKLIDISGSVQRCHVALSVSLVLYLCGEVELKLNASLSDCGLAKKV